ncbi:MAG: peptidase M13 [Actinobacteria bacterium]|nr:peptidase M13 [Actinomycetota bacterium]
MCLMKSGIELAYFDRTTRAADDLFHHVNGGWLANFTIPEDRASDGVGYELFERAEAQVRSIIENTMQMDGEPGKVGALYKSFLDTDRIESLGVSPIATDLAKAQAVHNSKDFLATLGELEMHGLGGLFSTSIYTDHMNSNENIVYFGQGGLSLPDEAYYREEEYAEIRAALLEHIEKMFLLAGLADASGKAGRVLALETQIAAVHWDQVKDRDATLTYNKVTRSQLEQLAPGFDWSTYLRAGQIAAHVLESTVVREPDFFTGIAHLLTEFDCEKWVAWLQWQIISGAAPYLNEAIVQQNFAFYGTTLSGTPKIRARWKRAVSLIEGSLGEAVGRIYVKEHFPPESKSAMQKLVVNLVEAYRESITNLDWMSELTKTKALEKLDQFMPKIGYPDKWRDYSALEIDASDLMGNIARISRFSRDFELAKIGAPVDRTEWYMTPQTVNAYYNPGMNEIVFPAAILQPPFFDLEADDAANYGGIGAIIGHEIGHGFDDQGSKYDGLGNLNDWWTPTDRAEFDKRSQALIEQYNVLVPSQAPDITVNGALTVGENIGDLGGLSIAFKAYLISLNGTTAPVIDSFTGEQRFFIAWAQAWRSAIRPEALRREIATDPHSPHEFRANQVIRNLDAFYEAFDVQESDRLFMPEKLRVRIW